MLLLAAAQETGLLKHLSDALPASHEADSFPLVDRSLLVRQRLLLTLLFLGAMGLHRPWDLRSYTADGLALLTGRKRAYGYRLTEAFLSQIALASGAENLTNALAIWTTRLWHNNEEGSEYPQRLTCYIDGHRKPVYSDVLIPRGLIGRLGIVSGCRALVLLHDKEGHPLLATTHRGDQHLTIGLPSIIARYEHAIAHSHVDRIIVDREGMATDLLADLHTQGRAVVTILRSNQYQDVTSFSEVGSFVPLSTNASGECFREVAPAQIRLSRPDHPAEPLSLQVALIRDLRRLVTAEPSPSETSLVCDELPAVQRIPKLIPIVTTASNIDAVELAQTYIQRWPVQENVIKDYLRPLGIDTNHGFAKTLVENSEVSRRRAQLTQRLSRLKQWESSARKRQANALRRRERFLAGRQKRAQQLNSQLRHDQEQWREQGLCELLIERATKKQRRRDYEELVEWRPKEFQINEDITNEERKRAGYQREQQETARALEELKAKERLMYELDHRKDQVMTVCKVALANLAMWTRQQYFPASYAHATWQTLAPFFLLAGTIEPSGSRVQVKLTGFNDRALNRDLAQLCARANEASPHLPDGRLLQFILPSSRCGLSAHTPPKIP